MLITPHACIPFLVKYSTSSSNYTHKNLINTRPVHFQLLSIVSTRDRCWLLQFSTRRGIWSQDTRLKEFSQDPKHGRGVEVYKCNETYLGPPKKNFHSHVHLLNYSHGRIYSPLLPSLTATGIRTTPTTGISTPATQFHCTLRPCEAL